MKISDKKVEQRILEAASRFIFQRGVRGWNMDQLAAEAGIAKNTLYKMISSKEDIIERVIINYVQEVQSKMIDLMEKDLSYPDRLRQMMSYFPRLLGMASSQTLREVFLEYPGIQEAVLRHRDALTDRIIDFLQQGIDAGLLRSELQAEFIFKMLQALVVYFVRSSEQGALEHNLNQAFGYLMQGIQSDS